MKTKGKLIAAYCRDYTIEGDNGRKYKVKGDVVKRSKTDSKCRHAGGRRMTMQEIKDEAEAYAEKLKNFTPQEQAFSALAYQDGTLNGLHKHAHAYLAKTKKLKARYEKQKEINKELVEENEQLKTRAEKAEAFNKQWEAVNDDLLEENEQLKAQIEKMKCCEICNHNRGGCSYHHNWTKECLENKHKYFELKE